MNKKIIKRIVLLLLLIYILYAVYNLSFPITAKEVVGNYSNSEEAIKSIELWQLNNIKIVECKLWKFPCISDRYYLGGKVVNKTNICFKGGSNTRWVRFMKCGSCGENSFLFSEFTNSLGIETRSLHDNGIDHGWDESYINNSWIIVDPSQNKYNLLYNYYESKEWGYKNHTYVYSVSKNGSIEDRTMDYTKTVMLYVYIANKSAKENITVSVRWGIIAPNCYTSKNDYCIFNLGDNNNYSISAEKYTFFNFVRYYDQQEVELSGEFPDVKITLSPKIDKSWMILEIGGIIIILLLILIIIILKKLPKRWGRLT